jgi:hypothetical protein
LADTATARKHHVYSSRHELYRRRLDEGVAADSGNYFDAMAAERIDLSSALQNELLSNS